MLYCPEIVKEKLEEAKSKSVTADSVNSIILKCIELGLKELYGIKIKIEG